MSGKQTPKYLIRKKFHIPYNEIVRNYAREGDKRPCDFLFPCDFEDGIND